MALGQDLQVSHNPDFVKEFWQADRARYAPCLPQKNQRGNLFGLAEILPQERFKLSHNGSPSLQIKFVKARICPPP